MIEVYEHGAFIQQTFIENLFVPCIGYKKLLPSFSSEWDKEIKYIKDIKSDGNNCNE